MLLKRLESRNDAKILSITLFLRRQDLSSIKFDAADFTTNNHPDLTVFMILKSEQFL